ncbi:DUF4191 domain-containing protein [Natronoglycomyces albus]|uniref:DUF4191 domain-containing protein n=1 Tax=Natronoglycomyces albus TaxID=2811108 RepID=A0A895XLC1_9ACTN|nr:DUF4191 domain-containing protein [Natronoglycomyces albus]QSB04219.1 DUF4191 domain-containing protein [Natronoglycomyces albus]
MAKQQEKTSFKDKLKTIGMAFKYTTKRDKWFLPVQAIVVLLPFIIVTALVVFLSWPWFWYVSALFIALIGCMITLNTRTTKVISKEAVGRPGGGYALIDGMRGWHMTPAVAAASETDMVHRAVGKPGVVLLAEGGGKSRKLMSQERKRISRVVGSTPVYTFVIGEGENEVSVTDLRKTLMKLPRNIKAKDANHVHKRLTALGNALPMPKGPTPTSTNAMKGARRSMLRGR